MKNVLFISFDLIREGEPEISLSAASLIAYLKNAKTYGDVFNLKHQTVNCYKETSEVNAFETVFKTVSLSSLDIIALSSHIWAEKYVQYFIHKLRKLKWSGVIILGGPQMNDTFNNLTNRYSKANVFIQGYGEQSFLDVCENVESYKSKVVVLSKSTPANKVQAVYSNGLIKINDKQAMVRLETKRNCPYNCSFCHFTDYSSNKVYCLNEDLVRNEINFLKQKDVQKVNIMDPTFNILNQNNIIDYIDKINYKSLFTFQSHFNVLRKNIEEKLNLFNKINSHLEFGLQCINKKTLSEVNRSHDLLQVKEVIKNMVRMDMSFEISLIYGLPYQTIETFKDAVKFLTDLGVKNIYGFPLQLYNGTQLYNKRKEYEISTVANELLIPEVVSTKWMNKDEVLFLKNWLKIRDK